ncbi:hypothetical protein [Methylobacterium sp. WL120]|uniref:hypothetical protein n=1 Tax=Methylobacterium sp. WL120 TaxID=2603887 RepID=UPI0011CB7DD1|nr:hypothetical protein [Methylobacterium sp. WL120]TXM69658.1 hypothetical protein FV229_04755 [Methylobacterium sp. WL120]
MTHDPCRHSCCIPPTAREAVERQRVNMERRKRDLLQDIKEAAAWSRPLVVSFDRLDAKEALLSDGLVIETPDGLRPHP